MYGPSRPHPNLSNIMLVSFNVSKDLFRGKWIKEMYFKKNEYNEKECFFWNEGLKTTQYTYIHVLINISHAQVHDEVVRYS